MTKYDEERKLFERIWKEPATLELENSKRAKRERKEIVELLGSTPLPTEYGSFTYMVFGDLTNGQFHTVVFYGDAKRGLRSKKRILLRIHSACGASELLHSTNCECREELDEALKRISKNRSGMLIYMNQEGAGNGIEVKIRQYSKMYTWKNGRIVNAKNKAGNPISAYDAFKELGYPPENRSFEVAAAILKKLGVKKVKLMTNNPKKIEGLRQYGIDVEPDSIHIKPKNKVMREHLVAKAKLLGHSISEKDLK